MATGPAALGDASHLVRLADLAGGDADDALLGRRIKEARAVAGLTGEQLGTALGLRRDQVSKIESGRRRVSISELALAAQALGTTPRALLGVEVERRLALAARLAVPGSIHSSPARRRARQLLEIADLLAKVTGMPRAAMSKPGREILERGRELGQCPPVSVSQAREQGMVLAKTARELLDLGSSEIGNLADLIEQHFAADVSLDPFGAEIDGICVHADDWALLLVSSDFDALRQRFTLAHELSHHLFGDPREIIDETSQDMFSTDLVEKRANAFAGYLLLPSDRIAELWPPSTALPSANAERQIVVLMGLFGVSFEAVVTQLNFLKLISWDQRQELISQRSRILAANRDREPARASSVRRAPERLVQWAISAARNQEIGLSVLSLLLERKDDEQLWEEFCARQPTPEPPSRSPSRRSLEADELEL